MTNKEIFDNFERSLPYHKRDVDSLSKYFGVSIPTIRKWQLHDGKVPNYAVVIINNRKSLKALEDDLTHWQLKYRNLKNDIDKYISSFNRLLKHE